VRCGESLLELIEVTAGLRDLVVVGQSLETGSFLVIPTYLQLDRIRGIDTAKEPEGGDGSVLHDGPK